MSSAQQRWELFDKKPRFSISVPDYDICIVTQTGWIRCIRKKLIRERVKPDLTERENRLVMGAIDDINADVGNSRGSDILVHCMGDWHGVEAAAMPAFEAGPGRGTKGVSATGPMPKGRLDAVRSTCRSGGRTAAAERDRWSHRQGASSVDSFGEAIEDCKDGKPSVASEGGDGREPKDREALKPKDREARKPKEIISVLDNGSERDAEAQRRKSADSSRTPPADAGVDIGQSVLFRVRETHAATGGSPAQIEAIDQAEQTLADKALTEAEAERTPEEQEAEQCLVDGQCTGPAASASRPPPPGGEGGSSCASRQASWNAFKGRCDNSAWRSWECTAFIRLLNRCTDPRLINPGPDGDLICRSPRPSDSEALRIADRCKREGMFAKYTPEGLPYCGRRPSMAKPRPRLGVDPCRGDLVNPNRDQCPARPQRGE